MGKREVRIFLVFLFTAGVFASGAAALELPRTGQTLCYDSSGAQIPCAGTGQDGEIRSGAPIPDPRFVDNGDGTMTDNLTGLVWLREIHCPQLGGTTWRPWGEILSAVAVLADGQCGLADGSVAGDWRMPNIVELESLYDGGVYTDFTTYLLNHGFTGNPTHMVRYYSSTTNAGTDNSSVHTLGQGHFYVTHYAKAGGYAASSLAVRGTSTRLWKTGQTTCYDAVPPFGEIPCAGTGQDGEYQAGVVWPVPRFTDNGDGTVTDNLTGLVWLKNASCFGNRAWTDGLADAGGLAGGQCGLTDGSTAGQWRMPNRKELFSLVDYGETFPKIPAGHPFTNVQTGYQAGPWTSTTFNPGSKEDSWIILFGDTCCGGSGSTGAGAKSGPWQNLLAVWPVRDGAVPSLHPDITVTDGAAPADNLSIPFGTLTAGLSQDNTVTLKNDGGADLTVGTIGGANPLSAPFSIAIDNCSGHVLATSESCSLTVRFSPTAAGAFNDTFDIPSDDPVNGSILFSVDGTGLAAPAPDITVTDSVAPVNDNQVLFGSVTTGTTSDQFVTVQNDGNANLVLGTIASVNPLSAPFSVIDNNSCSGRTLAPSERCTLTVRFSPSATGPFSDSFDIPSNDPDENPVTIAVGGTGIAPPAPDIAVTDSLGNGSDLAMPFPDTTEGVTSAAETVTLSNSGNAALAVSGIQLSGANSAEFVLDVNGGANPCGSATPSVAAGDNCTVTVAFAPASAGAKSATLAIASDDPDEATVDVALTGTGLSAATNNPPGKPTLVFPANGQTGLSSTVTFLWRPVTDPDGDPVAYDLHYCTDPDPIANCAPVQVASAGKRGEVALAGTTSAAGVLVLGSLLTLVVLAIPALRRKVLLLAVAVLLTGSLTVSCSDTDRPNLVSYTASGLSSGTTYHWAVVAKDNQGGSTASDVWQFLTQ